MKGLKPAASAIFRSSLLAFCLSNLQSLLRDHLEKFPNGNKIKLRASILSFFIVLLVLVGPRLSQAQVPLLVKDINPGSGSSEPSGHSNVNGTLFFRADDGTKGPELWKSDGTEAGTVLVKDIRPGGAPSGPP